METLVSRKRRDCACFARRREKMIPIGSRREGQRERKKEREKRGKAIGRLRKSGEKKESTSSEEGFFLKIEIEDESV